MLACAALGCARVRGRARPRSRRTRQPSGDAAAPAAPPILLRGARVMTAAGPTLERADVLGRERPHQRGRPRSGRAARAFGCIDVAGRWITPGIIDPHSHLGVYAVPATNSTADGNEMTGPFKPEIRAEDSFWPQDPAIERALAGGVTTIHVLPGSANLVGGQGVTLRLVPALSAREMRMPDAPATMKLACGENPMRIYGAAKGAEPHDAHGRGRDAAPEARERARLQARVRQGARLRDRRARAGAARRDPGAEPLLPRGRDAGAARPVRGVRHRAARVPPRGRGVQDPRPARARGRRRGGLGGLGGPQDGARRRRARERRAARSGRRARRAALRLAVRHPAPEPGSREGDGRGQSRRACRSTREAALRWITANPAWILGIDARTGTLEPGKDADLVVWSGDPFSVYAHAEQVFIEGRPMYDRAHPGAPRSDFELGLRGAE